MGVHSEQILGRTHEHFPNMDIMWITSPWSIVDYGIEGSVRDLKVQPLLSYINHHWKEHIFPSKICG